MEGNILTADRDGRGLEVVTELIWTTEARTNRIINMKPHHKLGWAALLVFVISHFLPAYGGSSGLGCFQVCWSTLWGHGEDVLTGSWFYYSGFAVSNTCFPVLVFALFVSKKIWTLRSFMSVVIFLQVISWPALHLFGDRSGFSEIQIGYYLWLLAYGGLVAAHFVKAPIEALDSTAVARAVS